MTSSAFILVLGFAALGDDPTCSPPPSVVTRLTAIFRYENGFGSNEPHQERFSFMKIGHRSYLRQNTVPQHYDPRTRPVWIFEDGAEVNGPGANCPPDAAWTDCAVYWGGHANEFTSVLQGNEEFHYPPAGVTPSVCDFTLNVPRWEPSPDSLEKRRIAAELLQEFRNFGYDDATRIVVRDFNLGDPEITAYITGGRGRADFQGCTFSRDETPHCSWHMFGQAPLSGLRSTVLSKPYQLFPPLSRRH